MSNQEEPTNDMITQQAKTTHPMDEAVAGEFGQIHASVPRETDAELDPTELDTPELDAPASAELVKGVIYLKNGAQLPTQICIKCGRPADKIIQKSLRDPFNPKTWFGKRDTIGLGLTRKHHENLMIARAITWTGLGVAALILTAGAVSLSVGMIVSGAIVAFAMSPIRSIFPVWVRTRKNSEEVELHGVGQGFLDQISWD